MEALKEWGNVLTEFERKDILNFNEIYCVGTRRVVSKFEPRDSEGFYIMKDGEAIGYRYLVQKKIDAGAFG